MTAQTTPMTKSQLTAQLAEQRGITKKDASSFLDAIIDIAYKETKKKGVFTLPGLGKLVLMKRKARKGRNPATGQEITIKAKTVVKFRVAKACKDAILPKAK